MARKTHPTRPTRPAHAARPTSSTSSTSSIRPIPARPRSSTLPATPAAPSASAAPPAHPAHPAPLRTVPRRGAAPALPLSLLLEEYWRDLRRREISPKTIRNYQQVLSLVSAFWEQRLGRTPTLDDVTRTNAEAFLDHLLERGKLAHWQTPDVLAGVPLSVETLRTYVRTLKVFASWLADPKQGYTSEQRLAHLAMPRKPQTYKLPLEPDEIAALVGVCDPSTLLGARDLALVLTLLDAGLRAGELIALRVGDVNLETGQLFIRAGKGQKSRQIAVGEHTTRALRRYALYSEALQGRDADAAAAPFFRTDAGTAFKYWGLRTWLVRLKRRAGVERAFPHLLRHTSAVRTLEVPGSDLFTLQEKLGHADIATTRRYLHMTTTQLSARQRTFSPVDHLGVGGPQRTPPPAKGELRLWHKRRPTADEAQQQPGQKGDRTQERR